MIFTLNTDQASTRPHLVKFIDIIENPLANNSRYFNPYISFVRGSLYIHHFPRGSLRHSPCILVGTARTYAYICAVGHVVLSSYSQYYIRCGNIVYWAGGSWLQLFTQFTCIYTRLLFPTTLIPLSQFSKGRRRSSRLCWRWRCRSRIRCLWVYLLCEVGLEEGRSRSNNGVIVGSLFSWFSGSPGSTPCLYSS